MFRLLEKMRASKARKIAKANADSAWQQNMARFDERVRLARARHEGVRHIEAERMQFAHAALRGGQ